MLYPFRYKASTMWIKSTNVDLHLYAAQHQVNRNDENKNFNTCTRDVFDSNLLSTNSLYAYTSGLLADGSQW